MNTRVIIISLGFILIFVGTYLYIEWIKIFTYLRGKQMALSPQSPAYAGWKNFPIPLYLDVYLFNWTNPEDLYEGSLKKAHFEQLGPYKFREITEKVNIAWHPYNYSVSFQKRTSYHFEADLSNGTLDDRITTINIVAYAAALRGKTVNLIERFFIEQLLERNNEHVTITKTANEWLFKGYKDPLLTMTSFLSLFRKMSSLPYDRVGWFYGRNNSATYEGHFNMYTGLDDITKMGKIYTWNFRTHNEFYGNNNCDKVMGSMGEFFTPNLSPNDTIVLYIPNICRAVHLNYVETVKIHGVTAFKFSAAENVVDNGTIYPENKCLCVDSNHCERSGVFNIAPCKYNTSVYMSFPHFYKADPYYVNAVEGLQPDPDKHEMFLIIEPRTGIPMASGGGFQVNYLMEPIKTSRLFNTIPRTFVPIMWAEQRLTITPEIADSLSWVPFLIHCGHVFSGILLALGITLLLSCYFTKCLKYKLFGNNEKKSMTSSKGKNSCNAEELNANDRKKSCENLPLMKITETGKITRIHQDFM